MGLQVRYQFSCQIVMNLEFSGQIFEKYSNIKFHENPSVQWEPSCYMLTDRHDEANSQFRNFTNAPKNCLGNYLHNRLILALLPIISDTALLCTSPIG